MRTITKRIIGTILVLFMIIGTLPFSVTVFGDSGDINLPDLPGGNGTSGDQPVVGPGGGGDTPIEPVPDDPVAQYISFSDGRRFQLISNDFETLVYPKATEYIIALRNENKEYQALSVSGSCKISQNSETGELIGNDNIAILIPQKEPDEDKDNIVCSLRYKSGNDSWLTVEDNTETSAFLTETSKEPSVTFSLVYDGSRMVFTAYNPDGDKMYYLCNDKMLNFYFIMHLTSNPPEFYLYQKVCEHADTHVDLVDPPSCTEIGSQYVTCDDCGTVTFESCPPLGHTFERRYTIKSQPSPDYNGIRYHACIRCGAQSDDEGFGYLRGDVDGDSSVTAADVEALKVFLADGTDTTHICLAGADLDGDSSYTARDVDMEKTLLAS